MNKSLRNKYIVFACIIVGILVLDLVTKYVIDGMFKEGTGVSAIPGLFNIISVHNFGAAWGIFEGSQAMLIIMSLVFLGIFIWYFVIEKRKSWLLFITFAFLCAGCFGNLYDRIVFGYVRDFIQFAFWQSFPIFNFADVFLTFGVIMFIIYLLIPLFKKEKQIVDTTGKIVIEKMDNKKEDTGANDNDIQELKISDEQKSLENKENILNDIENNAEVVSETEKMEDSEESQKQTDKADKNKTANKSKKVTTSKTKNSKTQNKSKEKSTKVEKIQKNSKNSTKKWK